LPVPSREIDLRSQLDAYQARNERERGHLERMKQLCDSVAEPFARRQFSPGHFTASAFILSPDQSELLLILHGKLGRWLQPGGHVDPTDPDLVAAARREVHEEVGLVELELAEPGPFDLDVHDIPARKDEASHQHFDVRYLFRARTRQVTAASDANDARWVPLAQIDAQLSDASVERVVEKLRSRAVPRPATLPIQS
jgi:8-oxo-dGTP pyrophosphatase MutT (NUDIX family)